MGNLVNQVEGSRKEVWEGSVCLSACLSVSVLHTQQIRTKKKTSYSCSWLVCTCSSPGSAAVRCSVVYFYLPLLQCVLLYSHPFIQSLLQSSPPSPSINHSLSNHSFTTTGIKSCSSPPSHSSWLAWPFSPSLQLRHSADLVLDHALRETAALLLYGLLHDFPSP